MEREILALRAPRAEGTFRVEFARFFRRDFAAPSYSEANAMSEVQHETVYFSGHVQGVGFRYTTLQVAKEFEVTGFVRNLPDGRVQLEAEGARPEIEAFLRGLAEAMPGYIRKTERTSERRPAQFQGFAIR